MHPSALNFGKLFFETYCTDLREAKVHDVGAQNVNGSLKDVLPPHLGYVGVDFVAGAGVDIVLEDPYKLPFADQSLDVLVCSSCFEHSQFFWIVFLEMLRVLKPQGLLYLNVPSNGSIHRYPVDCWRFYPDSGRALEAWAARNGYATQLMESFVGGRSPDSYESGGAWHDFVAVFVKEGQHAAAYPERMLDALQRFSNGYDSRTGAEKQPEYLSPDHAELVAMLRANQELTRATDDLRRQVAESEQRLSSLDAQLRAAHAGLEEILHSRSWRFMAPARKMMRTARIVRSRARSLTARLAGAAGSTAAADSAVIRASGLFDETFYRSANPDLPTGIDAIAHYCERGWREGRDPSPKFSTRYYLDTNRDIRDGGINPFVHYIVAGASERRKPRPDSRRERAAEASQPAADPEPEPIARARL